MESVQFQIVPCFSLYSSQGLWFPSNVASANYRVLICCICHFQSGFLLFVFSGFLCLQVSSVSNFHPDTRGQRWSLVQLCCGEERTPKNRSHWRVGGALAVSGPHWVCPAHDVCALPVYTAQAPGCSAGELSKAGPGFVHFPVLSHLGSGSQALHKAADSWACIWCPSQI